MSQNMLSSCMPQRKNLSVYKHWVIMTDLCELGFINVSIFIKKTMFLPHKSRDALDKLSGPAFSVSVVNV